MSLVLQSYYENIISLNSKICQSSNINYLQIQYDDRKRDGLLIVMSND